MQIIFNKNYFGCWVTGTAELMTQHLSTNFLAHPVGTISDPALIKIMNAMLPHHSLT